MMAGQRGSTSDKYPGWLHIVLGGACKKRFNVRKVVIEGMARRKSGENRYSFSIPLGFALRHHFFVEKTMSCDIIGNNRICRFLTKKKDQKYYDAKLIF